MLSEVAATTVVGCYVFMPHLCLKNGVHINGAHFDDVMVRIIKVAKDTAPELKNDTIWITSANDSEHMEGSLHYENRAFDIRIKNIIGNVRIEARAWVERMQEALGDNYDVLLESDHIHVEYDPVPMDGFNLRIK